ncbi:MAG: glycosyltransferase [Cetobacterium sp.]
MIKKKNFVHICEEFEYTWIGKDNGMIPIYVKEILDYESKIITCNLKNDLPDEIRDVEIIKIPRWLKKMKKFAPWVMFLKRIPLYRYICKNAKDIDVLMLFHITKCSYWNAYFYKKFNPHGKIFIKADFNLKVYEKEIEKTKMNPKNLREFFRKRREIKEYNKRKKLVSMADLISYETEEAYKKMKDSYAGISTKGKTIMLPNGYDDLLIKKNFKLKNYSEKENIFLTVGRLGTEEKNTEFLLKVLETTELKDWKFFFVGGIENKFQRKIDDFFQKFPEKKEQIIFTGIVKDRDVLYEYYNRSKVFVLPSKWESFGIVMVEALAFNNYILTSNTCAAKDITNDEEVGEIFPIDEMKTLKEKMEKIIDGKLDLAKKENKIIHQKEKFKYSKLIERIKNGL